MTEQKNTQGSAAESAVEQTTEQTTEQMTHPSAAEQAALENAAPENAALPQNTQPYSLRIVARVHSDFPAKFGIPRQSGVVPQLKARVVFEPEFQKPDALRGIEGFSHLWLIWAFSGNLRAGWSPTVRPPRLGGNTRMGVFATRSPFRPNPLGLSCVQLERVEWNTKNGPVLHILGADLMDGTPIFDIKPYLPFADSHPGALGGFAEPVREHALAVECPPALLQKLPPQSREGLLGALRQDPRPSYQEDPTRVYGMSFAGFEVKFTVAGSVLTVCQITRG